MDGATNNNAPVPGTPEYNAQMAQVGDNVIVNSGNALPTKGGDPASTPPAGELDGIENGGGEKLLAGKFKTVEELEAAFQQLSNGQQQENPQGNTEGNTQQPNTEEAKNATTEDAQKALQNAGLNFSEFEAEFNQAGSLSDASYKKLADAGIPKAMVDAYIEGQQAKADLIIEKVTGVVGGVETYQKMVEWARNNLTPEEVAAYDRTATQGDLFTAQLAAEGLYRRYTQAVGTNNQFITGSTNAQSTDVFTSTAQVTQAMRDPRYRSDPAYRREVAEKIARSNIL